MNQPNHKLKLKTLSTILLLSGIISFPTLAQKSSDVGTINIAGEGDNLGVGYMIQDDGLKQKSTITKSVIDKSVPSQNITDFLMLAPGVNSLSYDGTGLWGGTINYRGFAMNQMGFTVNGMPVNDAANYAVYPMEYIDSANLCEVYITGSVDNEAPHVAASGGNIGLVSCRPKNERSGKVTVSYGSSNYSNIFARIDSGLLGEDKSAKFFISYSHGQRPFEGPSSIQHAWCLAQISPAAPQISIWRPWCACPVPCLLLVSPPPIPGTSLVPLVVSLLQRPCTWTCTT